MHRAKPGSPGAAELNVVLILPGRVDDSAVFRRSVLERPLGDSVRWGATLTLLSVLPLHLIVRSRERFSQFVRRPLPRGAIQRLQRTQSAWCTVRMILPPPLS